MKASELSKKTTPEGVDLLLASFPGLAGSREVTRAQNGHNTDSRERVEAYLNRLERVMDSPGAERLRERLTIKYCFDTANSELVEKTARNLYARDAAKAEREGRALDLEIGDFDEVKPNYHRAVLRAQRSQKESLHEWLNYIGSLGDDTYPAWFRYLVIRELRHMGPYDGAAQTFRARSKDTLAPFPPLNGEALAFVYDCMTARINPADVEHPHHDPDELFHRIRKNRFAPLYGYALHHLTVTQDRLSLNGEWVRYEQGSDPENLERALKGKGTGWCTAEGQAGPQLELGDFYVYFTKDKHDFYTAPRIAIRMENGQVAEIRGVEPDQGVEAALLAEAQRKAASLPGYHRFEKVVHDTSKVNALFEKVEKTVNGELIRFTEELTRDELRFLYEVDAKIEGFSMSSDRRIPAMREIRNQVEDLQTIFACSSAEIAASKADLTEETRIFLGSLNHGDEEILNSRGSPLVVAGSVNFNWSTTLRQIPSGITFLGPVEMIACRYLTSIGQVTFCDSAALSGCSKLTRLGENSSFNSYVNFSDSALRAIPAHTTFRGSVVLGRCRSLQEIGHGTAFHGEVLIHDCPSLHTVGENVACRSTVTLVRTPQLDISSLTTLRKSI